MASQLRNPDRRGTMRIQLGTRDRRPPRHGDPGRRRLRTPQPRSPQAERAHAHPQLPSPLNPGRHVNRSFWPRAARRAHLLTRRCGTQRTDEGTAPVALRRPWMRSSRPSKLYIGADVRQQTTSALRGRRARRRRRRVLIGEQQRASTGSHLGRLGLRSHRGPSFWSLAALALRRALVRACT